MGGDRFLPCSAGHACPACLAALAGPGQAGLSLPGTACLALPQVTWRASRLRGPLPSRHVTCAKRLAFRRGGQTFLERAQPFPSHGQDVPWPERPRRGPGRTADGAGWRRGRHGPAGNSAGRWTARGGPVLSRTPTRQARLGRGEGWRFLASKTPRPWPPLPGALPFYWPRKSCLARAPDMADLEGWPDCLRQWQGRPRRGPLPLLPSTLRMVMPGRHLPHERGDTWRFSGPSRGPYSVRALGWRGSGRGGFFRFRRTAGARSTGLNFSPSNVSGRYCGTPNRRRRQWPAWL